MEDEIFTIKDFCESKLKEMGSQFIAQAYPIDSEEDFDSIISKIKKEFYDATHYCFAYRMNNGNFKYSDAGEPNGTAGIRILNAIDHFRLTNILVIVIRYFGGKKLGVGLLGKTYYNSAEMVLNSAVKIKKTAFQKISVEAEFIFTSILHKAFSDFEVKVLNTVYAENLKFDCLVKPKYLKDFSKYLTDKTKGAVKIKKDEKIIYG